MLANCKTWEVKKLDSIGEYYSSTSLEANFCKDGSLKVISIGSYSENSKYVDQGLRINPNIELDKYVLKKNDLTMVLNDKTLTGKIIGRVLFIDEDNKYIYNQRTQRMVMNNNICDSIYFYHYINSPLLRRKIFLMTQGNTQIYLNFSSIINMVVAIPSLPEQTKIGKLFNSLDNLIDLSKSKTLKLKTIKQSLLNQMFI